MTACVLSAQSRNSGPHSVICSCQATEARHAERAWRQRAEAAEAALDQLRSDMLDVSADIKRQSEVGQRRVCVGAFDVRQPLCLQALQSATHNTK
jgi:hypothetical protein